MEPREYSWPQLFRELDDIKALQHRILKAQEQHEMDDDDRFELLNARVNWARGAGALGALLLPPATALFLHFVR